MCSFAGDLAELALGLEDHVPQVDALVGQKRRDLLVDVVLRGDLGLGATVGDHQLLPRVQLARQGGVAVGALVGEFALGHSISFPRTSKDTSLV